MCATIDESGFVLASDVQVGRTNHRRSGCTQRMECDLRWQSHVGDTDHYLERRCRTRERRKTNRAVRTRAYVQVVGGVSAGGLPMLYADLSRHQCTFLRTLTWLVGVRALA
jgi:hypothetical protein